MMERDCLLARWLTMTELAWMHVALDFGGRESGKKMNVITNLANVKCRNCERRVTLLKKSGYPS